MKRWMSDAAHLRAVHLWATFLWVCPGIPVTVLLRQSVPWLAFMSAYAIIMGHWSSWQGARAEQAADPDQPSPSQ